MEKNNTTPTNKIETALRSNNIQFIREYQFLKGLRKFRFDFLITEIDGIDCLKKNIRIAIEYEGGTYTKGAHIRGKHYSSDCEKYNLAQLNGYYVLRYTADYLKIRSGEYLIADEIKNLFYQINSKFQTVVFTNYFRNRSEKWKLLKKQQELL